jgi:hypothetical protein
MLNAQALEGTSMLRPLLGAAAALAALAPAAAQAGGFYGVQAGYGYGYSYARNSGYLHTGDFAPVQPSYRAPERFITGPAHHVYGQGHGHAPEVARSGERRYRAHAARGHHRPDRHARAGVHVHAGR